MNKTNTQNNKTGSINKADELRQLKLKKMEENNVKISKQLDRSADTWKNSMEQIRKIAKKTQDSSQILDNVFTENENEKSEIETEVPKGHPRSEMGDFTYYRSMPTFNSPFRPLSQHANYTSNYFNTNFPNRISELNYRMINEYQPNNIDLNLQNIQNLHSFNQSNSFTYPQPPSLPKFIYPNNRPINPWMSGLNQSNSALPNSILNPINFHQNYSRPLTSFYPSNGYGNPYPNPPNFYPQNQIFNPLIHNPYRPTYHFPKEDVNGIESMKKYVNSLLDKLELLNETVAKLKNPTHNTNSGIKGCSHSNSVNHEYIPNQSFRHQSNCCSCQVHVPKMPRSCSCWDLPQHNHRRPPSSLSENYAYASTYNNCHHNANGTPYSVNNYHLNCKTNDCRLHMPSKINRERFIMHERQHFREYSHHQPVSNYHNYMQYQNRLSNQHSNHFNHIKPSTPSYSLENHDPSSVALIIDNSNNNNITNIVDVDSSDKSFHDLLSLTELPDTSSM